MEESVDRLYTPPLCEAAARAFGAHPRALETLGDFENYVYGFEHESGPKVLRVTHPSHRSAADIEAEVAWVEFLVGRGVRFARPLRSTRGAWVETIGEGEATFHVCAFERVPGRLPTAEDWTPALFEEWGRFLGQAHRHSVEYSEPAHGPRRTRWTSDPYLLNGLRWIPEDHKAVRERWIETFDALRALPEEAGAFGICHTDLHQGNFHVHEGRMYAFDTDDCAHQYLVEDLSSVFYYGRRHPGAGEDPLAFMEWAWPAFMAGYRSTYDLPQVWLQRIPLFQQARRLMLYAIVHFKFAAGDPERTEFVERNRGPIESGDPVIDFDFGAF